MLSSFPGVPLPTTLAVVVVLCAIALAFLVARASDRSARGGSRHRAADLFRLLAGRLAGNVPVRALREAARETQAGAFWDAIEAIAATLRLTERRALAKSLDRNRHVIAERRALREDDDPSRRETAARRLGVLPTPKSRKTLRRALLAGPEGVRFEAARSLAAYRDLAALAWIVGNPGALGRRPAAALAGLLRGFGAGARALLISALERGIPDPAFECAAIDALGLGRCRSARGVIEGRLRHDSAEVRIAATRALGRIGMAEATPALLLALADPSWPVRAQAARALGRLRAAPAIEALAERVSDHAWWVRHHAAYALAAMGSEGRDALCELVVRSNDPYAREMAREALDRGVRRTA